MDYKTLDSKNNLIDGVIMYPLKVNRDTRGFLVETLKTNWPKIYSPDRPFTQNYYSKTEKQVARDEDQWHIHQNQEDRFIVISGNLIVALCDQRPGSITKGLLNLYKMGENNGDNGQYLLLIPKKVLHGFVVIGDQPAILTNYPTRLYDPDDEGRIPHKESGAKFPDGTPFSWEKIRDEFYG